MATLTLQLVDLPDDVITWITQEGKPQYRSPKGQAEYLCAQYLLRAYQTAKRGIKGAPLVPTNGRGALEESDG